MYRFDLRFCVPVVINILKSQVGWDPFDTIGHPTWTKISCFLPIIVVFSFTSIEVPLICSVMGECMHLRVVGDFSVAITVSMVASFTFPQALFWYIYPIIILVSVKYVWVLNVVKCFLGWLQGMAISAPGCNIIISATHQEEEEEDELMISSEDGALKAVIVEE